MQGERKAAAQQPASDSSADPSLDESLVLALEYFRAGRRGEAEEIYRNVLAAEPDHSLSLHHLGLIAHDRGDHGKAAALVGRVVAIQPDYGPQRDRPLRRADRLAGAAEGAVDRAKIG
jgi:Tfp pilus assembly protein PilF